MRRNKRLKSWFILFLTVFLAVSFHSGCTYDNSVVTAEVSPTVSPSASPTVPSQAELDEVLEKYFTSEQINQISTEARGIIARYQGMNVLSSAQYGLVCMAGTVDLKDVFDARIPGNYEIFKEYAKENFLILNPPENEQYGMYALAAINFMRDFEYSAVLFRPDEYHPVLTKTTDTWLFMREDPDGNPQGGGGKFYYSGLIKNRRPIINGGMNMTPINSTSLWLFYIPVAGTTYTSYYVRNEEPDTGFGDPSLLNNYTPADPDQETLLLRQQAGIVESALSDRTNLMVCSWKNQDYTDDLWHNGFTFSGDEERFTWSGCGHYLLVLDKDFWDNL